jgi:hypothetical protein
VVPIAELGSARHGLHILFFASSSLVQAERYQAQDAEVQFDEARGFATLRELCDQEH